MRRAHIAIQTRRHELRLTQEQLAASVGVTRKTLSHWETGTRIVPSRWRDRLAHQLQIDASDLFRSVQAPSPWRIAKSDDATRLPTRANYPIGGTIDEMLRQGRRSERIYQAARALLSEEDHQVVLDEFPRDTAFELLFIFTLIANGGQLTWSSPSRLQCPLLVMDDFLPEYGGDQMQWAIEWQREDERFVVFGQIRIKAPYVKWSGRADFLVFHKQPGQHGQWTIVEFDGRHHPSQTARDEDRAEGLLIPELRYDNEKLRIEHWFPGFLEKLRKTSERGAQLEKQRRKQAHRLRAERVHEIEQRRAAA